MFNVLIACKYNHLWRIYLIKKDDKYKKYREGGEVLVNENTQTIIEGLIAMGQTEMAEQLRAKFTSEPNKDRSYHYLPYHVDSDFESVFLNEVLTQQCIHDHNLYMPSRTNYFCGFIKNLRVLPYYFFLQLLK